MLKPVVKEIKRIYTKAVKARTWKQARKIRKRMKREQSVQLSGQSSSTR